MTRRRPPSAHLVATGAFALLLLSVAGASQNPEQVSSPSPAHGAAGVSTTTALAWIDALDARRYDVRLGTTTSPPIVSRNHNGTTYQPPAPLAAGTAYYWRVDARGRGNVVTNGPLWTFTTAAAPTPAPATPASPSPAHAATGVAITAAVGWAPSANATTYDVAFGTTTTPPMVSSNQTSPSYDPPGDLSSATTYFWRVTAKGPGGSTAGPLWTFTTASATVPPPPTSLERLRLMTWNIQQGYNKTGALAVDAQVALMADSGAHVILLQEVTVNADGDLTTLYQSKLQALTGKVWHKVWAPAPRPAPATPEGNMILTTLPIASSATLEMNTAPGDPTFLDTKRSAVHAAVIVNGITVNVFGTHLAVNATHRQTQIAVLQDWLSTFPAPRLVGGDFNFLEGENAYRELAGLFADVWPALAGADPGFTMDVRTQAPGPGRIDCWWQEKSDTTRATEVWLIKTTRSDHHALVVDVDVR